MRSLALAKSIDASAAHRVGRSRGPQELNPTFHPATSSATSLQRKASCACGGGCPDCQAKSSELKVSQPNDPAEIEADSIADKVMRMPLAENENTFSNSAARQKIQRQPAGQTPAAEEEPDPLGEGLSTVADNLNENNPAFSEVTENLAGRFLAQPAPISVGIPSFLGANYVFLWTMALANRDMRRHLNDFNFGMLPGIIPQFPIKTFTYRILNPEQTRFEFDLGLDASGLIGMLNEQAFNTHISTLSLETAGRLDTEAPTGASTVGLSSLNVNLGLFDDGLMLSGGFRQGVDPYPLLERDPHTGQGSRIMQQVPGLPDLYPGQQDVRFMLQVDFIKLYNHFNPERTPIRTNVPREVKGDRVDRQIQRKGEPSQSTESSSDLTTAHAHTESYVASLSGGKTLSDKERDFFEARFGHDLSNVKLHTDSRANNFAKNVNARACTHGNNIVFGSDEYQPDTAEGKKLMAHELAHVVQQGNTLSPKIQRSPNRCEGTACLHEELAEQYAGPEAPPGIQYSPGYERWLAGGGSRTTPTPTPTATPCPSSVSIGTLASFSHGNLSAADKDIWGTYLGVASQMNVGPGPDHTGHCMKERLTTVSNNCPAQVYTRGATVSEPCTGNRCLDINRYGSSGDARTHSMVNDGPTSFVDLHRTMNAASLLDGSGVSSCSVVCEQVYTCDRTQATTGRFNITRNYVAGTHTRADRTVVNVTTGTVTKQ